MTARSGMSTLITDLRGMTDVGTAEFTAGGVVWFTDDQLEDVLDRHVVHYTRHLLPAMPEDIGGTAIYKRYQLPTSNLEGTASGTAVWRLENSAGSAFAYADFEIDHPLAIITMDSDQQGSALYLTARGFGLSAAAAEVWSRKGDFYANRFDVRTDNHDLKRSQLVKAARDAAAHYREMALSERITLVGGMARINRVDAR